MNVVSTLLGAAVVSAIVSSAVSVYLQRRELGQQRALHLYDRRVDTYTTLIDSANGVTAAVGTLGDAYDLARRTATNMSSKTFTSLTDTLKAAMQTFGRAQVAVLLIADHELRRLVSQISGVIGEMFTTAEETQRDETAMAQVMELAGQVEALRNRLLDCSRRELEDLLQLSSKQK